jgi:signal transduction histidine kinase
MALAIPVTLLLAVGGGLFLAGRALDPIDRVTRTAAQLTADNLARRLDFQGADDEVRRLAATFDTVLDRLESAFQRQRQFTADASHELRTHWHWCAVGSASHSSGGVDRLSTSGYSWTWIRTPDG